MKSTKKALTLSVLSLVLCFTMLLGTTYAWFTDSVTSGVNQIVAGNLDVEMYHSNAKVQNQKVQDETNLFRDKDGNEIKWEPGVMSYENFTVSNEGTLDLKYDFALNILDFNSVYVDTVRYDLRNVLKVAILEDEFFEDGRTEAMDLSFTSTLADFHASGSLEAKGSKDSSNNPTDVKKFAVVVYWQPSDADNIYNINNGKTTTDGQPLFVEFGIKLVATQLNSEIDSFDENYDKLAEYGYRINGQGQWNGIFTGKLLPKTDAAYATVLDGALEMGGQPVEIIPLTSANEAKLAAIGITLDGANVKYESEADQEVIICTKDSSAVLTVNTDTSTVHHYGFAASGNLLNAAQNSFHTHGQLPVINIWKGRIVLEKGSDVQFIFANKKQNTEEFDDITVAYDSENVTFPHVGRSEVDIPAQGNLVMKIQDGVRQATAEEDYFYLYKQGTISQMVIADEKPVDGKLLDESGKLKSDLRMGVALEGETNTRAAEELANNYYGQQFIGTTASGSKIPELDENGDIIPDDGKTLEEAIASDIESGGYTEEEKKEVENEILDNYIGSSEDGYVVRVGDTYYKTVAEALNAASDGDTVNVIKDFSENVTINGIKNLTVNMNSHKATGNVKFYDCDGVTMLNGNVMGQIIIGEHQYTIVKWQYKDQYPLYGYHPLAPAKNIVLTDLNVDAGSKTAIYYTNIEDDLTRGNVSNPVDRDLYGRYIYKTGYQTQEQSDYGKYDEVFTVCTDKDSVTINGGSYKTTGNLIGNMVNIDDVRYTDVLNIVDGTFSGDGLGRFVDSSKYLVGSSISTFTVTETAPEVYSGRVGNVYYSYEGGANGAIRFADFGETVYITESSDAAKQFKQEDVLTLVYIGDGVEYTGGWTDVKHYSMKTKTSETVDGGIEFYTAFEAIAAVYATGQGGDWKTATKVGEYAELQDAFKALQSNYTVVILKDFTVGDEYVDDKGVSGYAYGGGRYQCAAGYASRSTIDFNGHMITYTGTGSCIVSSQQTGYLYLKDTSAEKTGGITATSTNGVCFRKLNSKSDYTYISGGNYIANSNAIVLTSGAGITVSGGRFESANNSAISSCKSTTITGGTFVTYGTKAGISGSGTITGGTFTVQPTKNIASGKSAVDNGDGTWTVK